jgi:hypothetical protein
MGFGLWQKIKNGFSKVIGGIGKRLNLVKDKILKPVLSVAKPIANVAAPCIDKVLPGAGTAISTGIGIGDALISKADRLEPRLKTMQASLDPRLAARYTNTDPRLLG